MSSLRLELITCDTMAVGRVSLQDCNRARQHLVDANTIIGCYAAYNGRRGRTSNRTTEPRLLRRLVAPDLRVTEKLQPHFPSATYNTWWPVDQLGRPHHGTHLGRTAVARPSPRLSGFGCTLSS